MITVLLDQFLPDIYNRYYIYLKTINFGAPLNFVRFIFAPFLLVQLLDYVIYKIENDVKMRIMVKMLNNRYFVTYFWKIPGEFAQYYFFPLKYVKKAYFTYC